MAPGGQVGVRCFSPGSSSVYVAAYRHVSVGLGSPPVRSDGFGGVVPGREFAAHQCAGNDGSFSSSSCFSVLVVGSECRPDERQLKRHQGSTVSRVLSLMAAEVVL